MNNLIIKWKFLPWTHKIPPWGGIPTRLGTTAPHNLDSLLHGISCCLIHWRWVLKLWSSNCDLSGKQAPGLIWYEMIAIIKWIHLFVPPCICYCTQVVRAESNSTRIVIQKIQKKSSAKLPEPLQAEQICVTDRPIYILAMTNTFSYMSLL